MATRINAYLRDLGLASRREADRLVEEGKVLVNGKKAESGMMILPTDKVVVHSIKKKYRYLAYNKPRGLATQAPRGTDDVITQWKPKGLFPVGRLDKESEGLLILTDDGRLTTLFNKGVEKEYVVKVREELTPRVTMIFKKGMDTKSLGKLLPAKSIIDGPHQIRVILQEGKRHQIRVMLDELRYTVTSLRRVRVGPVTLGTLPPGESRQLTPEEVKKFGMVH